jgi:hypothetical protein
MHGWYDGLAHIIFLLKGNWDLPALLFYAVMALIKFRNFRAVP